MSDSNDAAELLGYLHSQRAVLEELHAYLSEYRSLDYDGQGKRRSSGLAVAGVLENYYTAAETLLFRVAQVFGNRLDPERWHASLLERLITEVPGIRPRVLSNDSCSRLDELRRFRHFRRYYFQLDSDWDRLEFLMKKLDELHPALMTDLDALDAFLAAVDG